MKRILVEFYFVFSPFPPIFVMLEVESIKKFDLTFFSVFTRLSADSPRLRLNYNLIRSHNQLKNGERSIGV